MFLKSVFLKTLRDHRVGALAWGLGPGLLLAVTLTQFHQLVATAEARSALVAMAQQFTWYEAPIGITRPGGFATFRLGPMLAVFPSIWMLLAASGTLRGEEARGMLDVVLSAPITRTRLVVEKSAGLAVALFVMAAVLGTLVWLAGVVAGAEYGALDAFVFALNVALTAAVYGAFALLVSQFTAERGTAAGLTGAALALSFLLHSTARVAPELNWLGYLSPLYYAGLTKPLVPEVGISSGGLLVLALLVLTFTTSAAWIFARRDLGFGYRVPFLPLPAPPVAPSEEPSEEPTEQRAFRLTGGWSLRSVFLRGLHTTGGTALWWAAGMAAFALWMTLVGKQVQANLLTIATASPLLAPMVGPLLSQSGTALFLGIVVFTFLPLMIAAFAITQATRWAADEADGRTEMVLASPVSRLYAILARYAAIAISLTGIALAVGLAVTAAAAMSDLAVDRTNVFAASLGLVPVALVVACAGALLSGWLRPGSLTGALTLYVVASFFLVFIAPIFKWPSALIRLSVFDVYGSPLVTGWDWPSMSALIATAAVCLALATLRFTQKDLGR